MIVFNEAAPAKLPEGNYLFLHCTSDQSPAKTNGQMDNVGFADVERDHPALRYVDFGSENLLGRVQGRPARMGQGDRGRRVGVAHRGGGEKNKMRAEFVGFSLDKSVHFMLTVAFPIFISNSVRWLGTGADDSEQGQIRTGSTLTIPAPPGTGKLTVTRPDGSKRDVVVAERGGAPFSDTDEAGLYTVEGPNSPKYVFAANLASASESDITPHRSLNVLENAAPPPRARC